MLMLTKQDVFRMHSRSRFLPWRWSYSGRRLAVRAETLERRYKMSVLKEVVVKVMSVPTDYKKDAMEKIGVTADKVAYTFSVSPISAINAKGYFTEPREYTVTLGLKVNA